jgi:hypothetical protein
VRKRITKHGLPYVLSLAHAHVNFHRKLGTSDEAIIDAGTLRRQDFFPSDFGFKLFVVLEGHPKTKENKTNDEIFSRTTMAKVLIKAILNGMSDRKISRRLHKLFVIAYITPKQNLAISSWQQSKSLELQSAFLKSSATWNRVVTAYIKEYKQVLDDLIQSRI